MKNKTVKRVTSSFLGATKLMVTSFVVYAIPSLMLNIGSTIAGHAISIKECYNYVAIIEFSIGMLAVCVYAIFCVVAILLIAMKKTLWYLDSCQ